MLPTGCFVSANASLDTAADARVIRKLVPAFARQRARVTPSPMGSLWKGARLENGSRRGWPVPRFRARRQSDHWDSHIPNDAYRELIPYVREFSHPQEMAIFGNVTATRINPRFILRLNWTRGYGRSV